jgi:hypothetical protein
MDAGALEMEAGQTQDELVALVAAAGGTMRLDDLRRAHPAWFRGNHVLALHGCRLGRFNPAFAQALAAELATGGRLQATRVYLVGRTPRRLPITAERRRCCASSQWPTELSLRR